LVRPQGRTASGPRGDSSACLWGEKGQINHNALVEPGHSGYVPIPMSRAASAHVEPHRRAMTELVYIGGYGHSGSTLIEYLMTGCRDIVACGEVGGGRLDEAAATRRCSCGELAKACPVWGPVIDQFRLLPSHTELDLALLRRMAGRHAVMVDSSKTAWRQGMVPFKLASRVEEGFFLLHVVRDPRAVCWSLIKRGERVGEPADGRLTCVATAFAWSLANLACELFRWRHPGRYLRVRYEDLVAAPCQVMSEVVARVLPNAEWRFEELGSSDNRHQLFGNRMRKQQLSLADIREDDEWRTRMPGEYQRLVTRLCWGLFRRYGYR